MITIVDYGMGNLGSIQNMLKKIGVSARISSQPEEVRGAEKLILPGVGAFDTAMRHLNDSGLRAVLEEQVLQKKVPVLGLCLGMQLLTRGSEEGALPGLGWIAADTLRFRFEGDSADLKVPHMGWNEVAPVHRESLFRDMDEEAGFYFVHSYHVRCDSDEQVLGRTHYGYDFTSAVQQGHILGAQFHPEKSHKHGMRLLHNFASLA